MAKLTKFEALQLAAAYTPEKILSADCYQNDTDRIRYLFDVADLIIQEDSRREAAKPKKPVEITSFP